MKEKIKEILCEFRFGKIQGVKWKCMPSCNYTSDCENACNQLMELKKKG